MAYFPNLNGEVYANAASARDPASIAMDWHSDGMRIIRPGGGRRLGKQTRRQLRVLYQDDAVVVLNKPAKLLSVPTDTGDLPSALSLLSEIGRAHV